MFSSRVVRVTVYRSRSVLPQGSQPRLSEVGKYELIGVTDPGEVVVLVDAESGEAIGIYCHVSESSKLVTEVYDLMGHAEIRGFVMELHRSDTIFLRSKVNRKPKHKAGVTQLSYMTGWIGANAFKRQPLPRLTRATTDTSYRLVNQQLTRLADIAAHYYRKHLPDLFERQIEAMSENTFVLGERVIDTAFYAGLWTSMIFNVNTSAEVHMDRRNIPSLNAIFCLRQDSVLAGGQLLLTEYRLHAPDGPLVLLRQNTGDLILYAAYNSYHGVTKLHGHGRATLVFYALNFGSKTKQKE